MVRSATRVVLRVRPSNVVNQNLTYSQDRKSVTISINKAQDLRSGLPSEKQGQHYQFKFDCILNGCTQDEVYQVCGEDLIKSALEGYNSTVMCYGQTGAGKTFTMGGGKSSFKDRGLIPRVLVQLFSDVKALSDRDVQVSVQYLEIYNESLYDLLDITTQPHEINIFESSRGSVTVSGLRVAHVGSDSEALQMLFEGETNRVIGEHQLNRESSRSHSIFTISIKMTTPGDEGETVVSKINLVDLAGSERVSKTKSEGVVLKEAGYINKSLSILEQVILASTEKNRDHVPFRSSKLTHVLKDSLGGNCKTILMANIWGDGGQTDETLSTCRLAQRMMRMQCEVTANVVDDSSGKSKVLQRQVMELQQELAMHDAMSSRTVTVVYGPYSQDQRDRLKQQVTQFLHLESGSSADITPLELLSVRHMHEILRACKEAYQELGSRGGGGAAVVVGGSFSRTELSSLPGRQAEALVNGRDNPDGCVGDVDGAVQSGGAGCNVPPEDGQETKEGPDDDGGASAMERLLAIQSGPPPGAQGVASVSGAAPSPSGKRAPGAHFPDRHQALEDYKLGPGQSAASLLSENKMKLRIVRRQAKELGLNINQAKRELDGLKRKAEEHKAFRMATASGDGREGVVMGAEEYEVVMRIKELKQNYRDHFSELQMVRSEVDYTQQLCEACTKELAMGFKAWYLSSYGSALEDNGGGDEELGDDGDDAHTTAASPTGSSASSSMFAHGRRPLDAGGAAGAVAPPPSGSKANLGYSPVHKPPGPNGMSSQQAVARKNLLGAGQGSAGLGPIPDEDAGDPVAAAYYNAQQQVVQRATNGVHRAGSVKKTAAATGFGTTSRALTNDKGKEGK